MKTEHARRISHLGITLVSLVTNLAAKGKALSLRDAESGEPHPIPPVSGCLMSRICKVYKSKRLVSVSFSSPLQPALPTPSLPQGT